MNTYIHKQNTQGWRCRIGKEITNHSGFILFKLPMGLMVLCFGLEDSSKDSSAETMFFWEVGEILSKRSLVERN